MFEGIVFPRRLVQQMQHAIDTQRVSGRRCCLIHFGQGSDLETIAGVVAITTAGGLLFGWLFVRWGFNLWLAIFLHVALNGLFVVFNLGDNAIGGWLLNGVRLAVVAIALAASFWLAPPRHRRARTPGAEVKVQAR